MPQKCTKYIKLTFKLHFFTLCAQFLLKLYVAPSSKLWSFSGKRMEGVTCIVWKALRKIANINSCFPRYFLEYGIKVCYTSSSYCTLIGYQLWRSVTVRSLKSDIMHNAFFHCKIIYPPPKCISLLSACLRLSTGCVSSLHNSKAHTSWLYLAVAYRRIGLSGAHRYLVHTPY